MDLGMALTARQERFGDAFLIAVASVAGCALSRPRPDVDSIDWTLSCRLPRRPKLDVQMKTLLEDDEGSRLISYPLKKKNYDDLRLTDVHCPRILVLVTLPPCVEDWLNQTPQQLVLRRSAYWVSLAGSPPSGNTTSVTVRVLRENFAYARGATLHNGKK